MTLAPGYGETPLDPEEAGALTAQARPLLGDDPTKADLYEAEQAILAEVSGELLGAIADGALGFDEILSDYFLRNLSPKALWRHLDLGRPVPHTRAEHRDRTGADRHGAARLH